jgi:hypothetical protein
VRQAAKPEKRKISEDVSWQKIQPDELQEDNAFEPCSEKDGVGAKSLEAGHFRRFKSRVAQRGKNTQ